jgi:hypothetical protein
MKPFLILCFTACAFAAEKPKIHIANFSADRKQIYVQFETPTALTDCDVEFATNRPNCPASVKAPWSVILIPSTGGAVNVPVISVKDEVGHFQSNGLVTLSLLEAVAKDPAAQVDVTFTKGDAPHFLIAASAQPARTWISPGKTKDDSDVYISGIVSPAVGAGPTYTIDSKAKYTVYSFGKSGASTLSVSGDIKTDNRKTADPDSFHWGLPYQHVSAHGPIENWSLLGMELDKKANAINLVSAPGITQVFGHTFSKADPKHPNVPLVRASVGMSLTAGLEFGDNLRNDYAVVNKSSRGEGAFLRGVPGAAVYLVVPQILHLNKISLSSSYTARIPTTDELFLETRHTQTPIPLLTSKTRHYLEDNLQFMVTEYAGFQIKHQYGSLPPAFNFVDHKVSVGLVFAFKETRVPAQSP